jgi:hypothetical protein
MPRRERDGTGGRLRTAAGEGGEEMRAKPRWLSPGGRRPTWDNEQELELEGVRLQVGYCSRRDRWMAAAFTARTCADVGEYKTESVAKRAAAKWALNELRRDVRELERLAKR